MAHRGTSWPMKGGVAACAASAIWLFISLRKAHMPGTRNRCSAVSSSRCNLSFTSITNITAMRRLDHLGQVGDRQARPYSHAISHVIHFRNGSKEGVGQADFALVNDAKSGRGVSIQLIDIEHTTKSALGSEHHLPITQLAGTDAPARAPLQCPPRLCRTLFVGAFALAAASPSSDWVLLPQGLQGHARRHCCQN
jgi:hypothetical protein